MSSGHQVSQMARGHWQHLLPALGVDAKYLTKNHGPCPICHGKDRFRWDDKDRLGGFICTQCGAGDGFDLVKKVTGQTFRQISEKIGSILGKPVILARKQEDQEEIENYHRIKSLWEASGRPKEGGPVSAYLQRRVGCLWPSNAIREHVGVWSEGKTHPTMLCKVMTHLDRPVNVHQTFLTDDGQKANVIKTKKVMVGKLPDGCAIRLAPSAPVMGVAEGVESAISASILHDMPVWACINGVLLSRWIPPQDAEWIYVFGDNDSNYTGQAKAYHLANRLEVQYKRKVVVVFPPNVDEDMNDVHRFAMRVRIVPENHLRVIK